MRVARRNSLAALTLCATCAVDVVASAPALEEVIVTARRQAESLQRTPVAVSALGEDALREAGIAAIEDVRQLVPSLQIASSGSKIPSMYIRGVGQRADRPDLDPGVGQYLNGIFIPRQDAILLDAVDVSNIQVLRGPQGTLFGKNNTGGAMLITTRDPDPETAEWSVSGKVGNYGRRDLKVAGNLPLLGNRAATRFALIRKDFDGYIENQVGRRYQDEDRYAATARFMLDLNDDWTVDLFGFWSKMDEASTPFTCILQDPNSLLMKTLVYAGQSDDIDLPTRCRESEAAAKDHKIISNTEDSVIQNEGTMLALTLRGRIGMFEVESITAWSHQYDINRREDQDGIDINLISQSAPILGDRLAAGGLSVPEEDRNQYSQEIRFSADAFDEKLQYSFGIFVSKETIIDSPRALSSGPQSLIGVAADDLPALVAGSGAPGFDFPPEIDAVAGRGDQIVPISVPTNVNTDLEIFSAAVFGQFNWDIREWWQLTMGARYTRESKDRRTEVYAADFDRYAELMNAAIASKPGGVSMTEHLDGGIYSALPVDQFHLIGPDVPVVPLLANPVIAQLERNFTQFTPSLTNTFFATDAQLEQLQLDTAMVYVTWSKGFKAGGLDVRGEIIQPFDAEVVENREIGFKIDAFGSRWRLNGAIYQMDYDDIQVTVAEAAGLTPINYLTNAGAAVIDGIEIESTVLLGNLLMALNAGYTEADYIEYTVGTTAGQEDRSAEPFPLVPKLTWGASIQYDWITDLGTFTPRLQYYWRDRIYTGQDGDGLKFDSSFIKEQGVWHARLTFIPIDSPWYLAAFINNLADDNYFDGGFGISRSYGAALKKLAAPRLYGIEFRYRFEG